MAPSSNKLTEVNLQCKGTGKKGCQFLSVVRNGYHTTKQIAMLLWASWFHRRASYYAEGTRYNAQSMAKEWFLGCVNARLVARGNQDEEFTQPRSHCLSVLYIGLA